VVAIAVTRPIPILAETVAILAGGSPMTWAQLLLAALAGSLVPSAAYAWAGASAQTFGMQTAIFGGVLAMAALLFVAGRRFGTRPEGARPLAAAEGDMNVLTKGK
jgi:uncharacterized membrane protein YdjX (TVP38/TMEM64 family)